MALVSVLLPLLFNHSFDYRVEDDAVLPIGTFVRVPFGRRLLVGIVWPKTENAPPVSPDKLKAIETVLALPALRPDYIDFLSRTARYTLAPLGLVLKMALLANDAFDAPKRARRETVIAMPNSQHRAVTLSPSQQDAASILVTAAGRADFSCTVLDGVTGSGKTEVYSQAIAAALAKGQQVLVLMPEIALTAGLLARFTDMFGAPPVLWHSTLTPAQRRNHWLAIADGRARLVVGARSAVMLPFINLGLIVVDEEHDTAYKQEEGVLYNARDMAVLRAKLAGHAVILSSATPSLETVYNAQQGRYQIAHLADRHAMAAMPQIALVDMRHEKLSSQTWLSEPLRQAVQQTLAAGQQSLLFLNRRGYAPLTLCRTCGHRLQCPQCTAWLVQHKYKNGQEKLMCHHCGLNSVMPDHCAQCDDTESFAACGPGVDRIDEEVRAAFPDARSLVLASDSADLPARMKAIADGAVDIVIGTQLVAKGHHFPAITLVGVVDGDLGLSGADLRAGERCFQMLQQVAGRAGREQKPGQAPGRVMIQTYQPDHPVMQAMQHYNRDAFVALELAARGRAHMPPFGRLAALIVSGPSERDVDGLCRMLAAAAPPMENVVVLGPAPAMMALLRGRHRRRFLIKGQGPAIALQPFIQNWLARVSVPRTCRVQIDIDPQSFW